MSTSLNSLTSTNRLVRMRGIVKCVPRLLGWVRNARISLENPTKHPEQLQLWVAEGDEMLASAENTLAKPCDEQAGLKRKWKDSLWCDDADRKKGARWAAIHIGPDHAKQPAVVYEKNYKHARIEALAGTDHLVVNFARGIHPRHIGATASLTAFDVGVLRDDEFTVDEMALFNPRECEDDFRKRHVQGLYGRPGHLLRLENRFDSDNDDE